MNERHEYRSDIMNKFDEKLDYMVKRHCKVYVMILLVRFPDGIKFNKPKELFSDFIATLSRYIRRQGIDFQRVAVCEQAYSENPHFHVMFMLDGNKVQSPYAVAVKADELWGLRLGISGTTGLVDYRNQKIGNDGLTNGQMLVRNADNFSYIYEQCRDAGMYFSKQYSKGGLEKNMREVMCSQVRS